jgi:hypothetical protein
VVTQWPVTLVRLSVVLVGAMLVTVSFAADDDEDSKAKSAKKAPQGGVFEGKWNNRKRGTSGPMRCELKPGDESDWSAKFEGSFQRSPFSYNVSFTATKSTAAKTDFKGTAEVDGGNYEYVALLKGDMLNVKYKGWNGNNGDFTLKRSAKKLEPKKKTPKRGGAS